MEMTERISSFETAIITAIRGMMKGMYFALPAQITKPSDGHVAEMASLIQGLVLQDDGTNQVVNLTVHGDAPVHFPGGGGVTATHPVQPNDEGIALIVSRAQDLWHRDGGVQPPIDSRMFDLSDARWIPGGRSGPRKMSPPPSTSSGQDRTDDGNHVRDYSANGLVSASTKKHKIVVTGGDPVQIQSTPGVIRKQAQKLLFNCTPFLDPAPNSPVATLAHNKGIALKPPPAVGSAASAISSVLSAVLSGGAGAAITNPTAASNASLSAAATAGAAALTAALGGAASPMVTALNGLVTGLTAHLTSTNNLSGVSTPAGGQFGLADLVNHAGLLSDYWGQVTPPVSVSWAAAIGPVASASTIAGMVTALNALVASVIAGSTTVASGTTQVNAMTATLAATVTASTTAIQTLLTASLALANVANAASLVTSQDPNAAQLGAMLSGASATLATLAANYAAIWSPSAGEMAASASFPDSTADQAGARGGL